MGGLRPPEVLEIFFKLRVTHYSLVRTMLGENDNRIFAGI